MLTIGRVLQGLIGAYAPTGDQTIEHFSRFGKQKLLMAGFQTPVLASEETRWQLTHIAYAQLRMARHVAQALPPPWERNLPAMKQRRLSPALVQRDFGRIIQQLGTPAQLPKPRGIFPGRRQGTTLPPLRSEHQTIENGPSFSQFDGKLGPTVSVGTRIGHSAPSHGPYTGYARFHSI